MTEPIADLLRRQARINARKVGLVNGDQKYTYREMNERANRLANALLGLGLTKGDKLAVMAANCHEFVEAYFAAAKVGLIIVPVNTRFTANEVVYQLNHSEASAFIYHQDYYSEIAGRTRAGLSTLKHYIAIGDCDGEDVVYEQLLCAGSPNEPRAPVGADDVFMIMYTSGATGTAKGVVTSHRNILATTNVQSVEARIVPEDIQLLVMPLFHAGGLWPMTSFVYRGGKTILLPRYDELTVMQMVEREKVTFLNLVPATLRRLVNHPELNKYDLSSLRLVMYAGAPIPLHQLREAMSILGPHRFFTGLGATEAGCGGMCLFPTTEHALALDGALKDKLGSVGRDGVGVEVKIVDENGVEQPPGVVGEITARGDNVALGYWKMPEDTAETFRDGWLYTGDLGYRDEDGYIFVAGRKKDLIITGGENVSSIEVEHVVSQHPAVDEVAVIGVPDEVWGEAVKAVVVLKAGQAGIDQNEIIIFCRARLAGYKVPKSVDFVAELPKNSANKIAKGELKKLYLEKSSSDL